MSVQANGIAGVTTYIETIINEVFDKLQCEAKSKSIAVCALDKGTGLREKIATEVMTNVNVMPPLHRVTLEMENCERLNYWTDVTNPMLIRTHRGDVELPTNVPSWLAIDLDGISAGSDDWYTAIYAKPINEQYHEWYLVHSIDFVSHARR